MGLADLHIHTIYSLDGTATVRAVLKKAVEVGLDIIAITGLRYQRHSRQ
jgi:predicted metal-dependent phosphoesterase TrpH